MKLETIIGSSFAGLLLGAGLTGIASAASSEPFLPSSNAPITGPRTSLTFGNETVSVTTYGLISVGIASVSNVNGAHYTTLLSGPQQPPRFGTRAFIDLGDGMSGIAVLEGGYSIANGTLGQGGRIFGRQAFVGLQGEQWGAVTLGRQYDEIPSYLWWANSANAFATFGDHIGDNDNIANTFRFNNSIRYRSPKFGGFSFALQKAFSNATGSGQGQNNDGWSVGGQFDARDASQNGLLVALGHTHLDRPNSASNSGGAVDSGYGFTSPFTTSPTAAKAAVLKHTMSVAGASYRFGPYTIAGGYSDVHFNYLDTSSRHLKNAEIYATAYVTPKLLAGIGVMKTKGEDSTGTEPNWRQVNLGVDYFLNRYLDLYLVLNHQRAGGSAKTAWLYTLSPSTTDRQTATTAGLRVKF